MPRLVEPGEYGHCACGRYDADGTWGPPGTDTVRLDDGNEHTIELRDTWFCRRHARARWEHWRTCQRALPERRRRLAAFAHVEALGVRDQRERFRQAEALLAAGWQPGVGVAA